MRNLISTLVLTSNALQYRRDRSLQPYNDINATAASTKLEELQSNIGHLSATCLHQQLPIFKVDTVRSKELIRICSLLRELGEVTTCTQRRILWKCKEHDKDGDFAKNYQASKLGNSSNNVIRNFTI